MTRITAFFLTILSLGGCGSMIPNTTVSDNGPNREVIRFMEGYRRAIEAGETAQVMKFVDEKYFDDAGTPNSDDDVDYEMLKASLKTLSERVSDIRYEVRYLRVHHEETEVVVDLRYTSRYKVKSVLHERGHWSRQVSDNRMVLRRVSGDKMPFRILSGM